MRIFAHKKEIRNDINTGVLISEAIIIYLILSKIFITLTGITKIRNLLLKACNKQ